MCWYFGEKVKTLLVLYLTKMNYWTNLLIHHWCKYLLSYIGSCSLPIVSYQLTSVEWNNSTLTESSFNEWCCHWFLGFFKELGVICFVAIHAVIVFETCVSILKYSEVFTVAEMAGKQPWEPSDTGKAILYKPSD